MQSLQFDLRRCQRCHRRKPKVSFPTFLDANRKPKRRKVCADCVARMRGPKRLIGVTPVEHDDRLGTRRAKMRAAAKSLACRTRAKSYEDALQAYLDAPPGTPEAARAFEDLKRTPCV